MIRRKLIAFLGLGLAAVALCGIRQQPTATKLPGFVTSGDTAYLLLDPVPIPASGVKMFSWSPTGQYLLLIAVDAHVGAAMRSLAAGQKGSQSAEVSLLLYQLENRRFTTLWKGDTATAMPSGADWLAGSNTAVISVTERMRVEDPTKGIPGRQTVMLVDAPSGAMRPLFSLDQENGFPRATIAPAPAKANALITVTRQPMVPEASGTAGGEGGQEVQALAQFSNFEYRMLGSDGTVVAMKLPTQSLVRGWWKDGYSPLLVQYAAEGRQVRESYLRWNPQSAVFEPVPRFEKWQPSQPAAPVSVKLVPGTVQISGHDKQVQNAWLQGDSDFPPAFIAANSNSAALAKDNGAVATLCEGVVSIRPILQLPKRALLAAMAEEEKQRVMQNAKMAGLATLMYAADYDDLTPAKDMTLSDVLGPYVKSSSALEGLVLTFNGNLSKINDPANAQLGYVPGAGGRAIIYADGHVVWVADK